MPEASEIHIMSDFINQNSTGFKFKKFFHVEKGNIPVDSNYNDFSVSSDFYGKQLQLNFNDLSNPISFSVFMGMSGNWTLVNTHDWSNTKFTRMRLDRDDGKSLLLYGGYMGPKYKIGKFDTKRGPDIVKDFDKFKIKILNNLTDKSFDNHICEVLLDQKYFNGIGAYLNAEIMGRVDIDPFRSFKSLNFEELNLLFDTSYQCCVESYNFGGGELRDWYNPFGKSKIKDWIRFYGNKDKCYRQKFGTRNIWIQKKWMR